MPTLRMRITGTDDDARAIANLLQSIDGIEHVEEVDDLMPHLDDEDSSSAGLSDDEGRAATSSKWKPATRPPRRRYATRCKSWRCSWMCLWNTKPTKVEPGSTYLRHMTARLDRS